MTLACWKCGATLAGVPLPFARTAGCPSCHADVHVCRMCRHFEPGRATMCRELAAEPVADKTKANFCGWFVPAADAYRGGGIANTRAQRAALDALFGDTSAPQPGPPERPEDLFKK